MDSRISIAVKNLDQSERIAEYIEKKVQRLDRLLPEIANFKFELVVAKNARNREDRETCQLTLTGKGFVLRTEERGVDMLTAIDKATDKMQRQIERFKGKRSRGRGDGTPAAQIGEDTIEPLEVKTAIVKRKVHILIPMDESEAIEQMALLAHEDFFVFFNIDTNNINVLYRRKDGDYGLIEPKMS